VIWSSPADGAVDVALDADLLLVVESFVLPAATVTLDDGSSERELERGSDLPGHIDLGMLEPDRGYTVRLQSAQPVNGVQPSPLELHFTTGQRRAAVAEGDLRLRSLSRAPAELAALTPDFCRDVLLADACYDTGEPTLYAFDVDAAPSPAGPESLWVIHQGALPAAQELAGFNDQWSTTWPTACGVPIAVSFTPDQREYRLYNISEGGVVRTSNSLSGEPERMAEPAADASVLPSRPAPILPGAPHSTSSMCDLQRSRAAASAPPSFVALASALALLLRRARATR
jgi:hypothetical protein